MNQLELHKKIEEFFKAGVGFADVKVAKELLANGDAKRFFFSQAGGAWIDWLWKNGFLNVIKEKSKDPTFISYTLPELEYLPRMAEKKPSIVAEIMLDKETATKDGNFNPEVVDRFLWTITNLPVEQIKLLIEKIRDERWVYSMRAFRKTGYEFERIVKRLADNKECDAILELAQAILIVKSKAEISEKRTGFNVDDPFYVSDLDASGIFEALANIPDSHREQALEITTGIMGDMVKLAEPDEAKIFDYMDLFSLFDVDFFALEIEDKRSYSYREDIRNLVAVIKKLIEKTIGGKCADANKAKQLFEYINKLPSCRSMWRLRLFTLTQCPDVFKNELKEAFFKLFSVENYYEIEGGTEYKKALKIAFPYLSDADQRDYVANIFQYFSDKSNKDPDKIWIKRTGWEILSSIPQESLTEEEKIACEKKFDKRPDQNFEPEPSVKMGEAGFVNHRSPVNLDDFTIDQIIANFKSEWTAEKLNDQFKNDDFLSPRGVEGLGDALKENTKKRTSEYLNKIDSFFDRDAIHPHYTYSLLRGVEEMIRNKQPLTLDQVGRLIGFFEIIKDSGEKMPFIKGDDKSWLSDWVTVHKVITDILLFILEDKENKEKVQTEYRVKIRDIISYLLTIKDSPSKEHEKPEYGELYGVAINSVRGRAYEALVIFTENDGKTLAGDVQGLYQKALIDDSLAVRFVVGRYLATFYFRDKKFITELLPEIFPKDDQAKKDIYLAAWEGYLSNTLYDKLFVELKEYYSHAITLDPKGYTQRKYFKGLDETLAIHLALAFAHLGLEIGDPLFTQFWNESNVVRHKEFISFIGQSCLSRDNGEEWFKQNKVSKEKLIKFWDWALTNNVEPEALSGFGFWVNPEKEVLDDNIVIEKMAETLKQSHGGLYWDYGVLKRLPIFAANNSEKTLEIIRNFLLDSSNELNQNRRFPMFSLDNEIKEALGIIYRAGDDKIKQNVTDLINTLIEKGSTMFWGLKDVLI